jgi:hypothetical protein
MIDRRRGAGLALEALVAVPISGRPQNLDRHRTIQTIVACLENHTHPAFADLADDPVVPNAVWDSHQSFDSGICNGAVQSSDGAAEV